VRSGSPSRAAADPARTPSHHRGRRGLAVAVTLVVLGALVALGLAKLHPAQVARALSRARGGWLAGAEALMVATFLARGESWFVALRSALPEARLSRGVVTRVLLIGMAGSTLAPSRAGEAARAALIVRRVGEVRESLPRVVGSLLSQTLLNLLALALLAALAIAHGTLPGSGSGALALALAVPAVVVVALVALPRVLIARAGVARRPGRLAGIVTGSLEGVRGGLSVLSRPSTALHSGVAQLLGWACQCGSCLLVLEAMGLGARTGVAAAAAILVAVNVTAILPLTPSNVGVFQAACIAVLARFGVRADTAFAYGVVLQGLEVATALGLGVPFALREGLWPGGARPLPGPPGAGPPVT